MSVVYMNAQKGTLLQWLWSVTSTPENLSLHLFTNNHTVGATDTTGSFTEASFTNYTAQPLTRGNWASPSGTSGTSTVTYPSITYTNGNASTAVTIYGVYVTGATNTTTLYFAETFASAVTLNPGDSFVYTLSLGDQ